MPGPAGDPRLGINVTVGQDAVQLLLDTGSAGLRLLASALHPQSANRVGKSAAGIYGSGLHLQGEEARASLTIGQAHGDGIPIELVDSYSWGDANSSRIPEMFGRLFPGILGVNLMVPPSRCCASPLPALAGGVGKRYIVHAAFDAPQLVLNPDNATVQSFSMADIGSAGWPQGCITIEKLLPYDFCGEVLFDTGTPQIVVSGVGIDSRGAAPAGSAAHLRLAGWSHDFVAGRDGRIFVRPARSNRIVIGLSALQKIDVLFDADRHQIGLRSL